MFFELALFSYILDRFFGEYPFLIHPVVAIGRLIDFFETNFYKDSIYRGFLLVLFVLSIVFLFSFFLSKTYFLIQLFFTTWLLASKSLYESVKDILNNPKNIKFLVSRDTKDLNESEINKAAIETYAENLNDGVIAPLFYLFFFGVIGIFLYKAVNTLDSMVGYKNEKYENFGKVSAKLDDILNLIPSRITAVLIIILSKKLSCFKILLLQAKKHLSPNAGYPITAMGCVVGVKLGGDTSYFGKIVKKPYFGVGKTKITKQDLLKALSFQKKLDFLVILIFIIYLIYYGIN